MEKLIDALSTDRIMSCRIRFLREAPTGTDGVVITKFVEPQPCVAVREDLPIEQLLNGQEHAAEDFFFLFVPDPLLTTDLRTRIDEWSKKCNDLSEEPAIESVARPHRIVWRPPHVVVLGEDRISEETVTALVHFAFLESELRRLEVKLSDYFLICPQDIPLTHGVGAFDLRRQAHINTMTQDVTAARMAFVRLTPCFDNLYGRLTSHTKHLIGELTEKTRVWDDRIEAIDDKLEFLEELYELANDRLTEFRYFRREATLEWWIIALLVAELAVMLWETGLLIFHGAG